MVDSAKRTQWLHDAKWGVFIHYLGYDLPAGDEEGVREWNRRVDGFDVRGLAEQLTAVKARYFWITLGQNSGHFCSPNATYDRLTGVRPGKCSHRDLIQDLYQALAPKGIRLLVYLPSHAPMRDPEATKALRCVPPWTFSQWSPREEDFSPADAAGNDDRLTVFQRNWEAVIREWSLRWGEKVWGWWFDGCYYADRMYRCPDEPNFKSFAAAARAGNSGSIVAWNPGVINPPVAMDVEEDYTAGEIVMPHEVIFPDRFIQGEQLQVLTYLGKTWWTLPVRFTPRQAIAATRSITDFGGVVTWDVPPTRTGLIEESAFTVLKAIGEAVESTRGSADRPVPTLPETACPTVQSASLLSLPLFNPHEKSISGQIQVVSATPGLKLAEGAMDYELAPKSTQTLRLRIEQAEPAVLDQFPWVETSFPEYPHLRRLRVSRRIDVPRLPSADALQETAAGIPAYEVYQAGTLLGRVQLGICGKNLMVLARVHDRLICRKEPIWTGSCLELFMTAPNGRPVRQLIFVPATTKGPGEVWRFGAKSGRVSEVQFTTENNADGYLARAIIPIDWLLETTRVPETFFLEMIFSASPDGKSLLRQPLFKSEEPVSTSEGYALVQTGSTI